MFTFTTQYNILWIYNTKIWGMNTQSLIFNFDVQTFKAQMTEHFQKFPNEPPKIICISHLYFPLLHNSFRAGNFYVGYS